MERHDQDGHGDAYQRQMHSVLPPDLTPQLSCEERSRLGSDEKQQATKAGGYQTATYIL